MNSLVAVALRLSAVVASSAGCGNTSDPGPLATAESAPNSPAAGGAILPNPTETAVRATGIACGKDFACSVTNNGAVWCWGMNNSGQLGTGDEPQALDILPPVRAVQGLGRASAVTAGASHACALLEDSGKVACWGMSDYGQVGDGSKIAYVSVPYPPGDWQRVERLNRRLSPVEVNLAVRVTPARWLVWLLGWSAQPVLFSLGWPHAPGQNQVG